MAKQERKELHAMAWSEDDLDETQQAIMADLRAAWQMAKELNAKLADTFAKCGPAGADIVISHTPWNKRVTWYEPREKVEKMQKPQMTLAQWRAAQANGGHSV